MTSPNVALIVLDTARASMVGRLLDEGKLPNLQRIANKGSRFRNCMSTAPWTLPSHASMFTGQYTSSHCAHAGTKSFDPQVPTLAERAEAAGYDTLAYSNNTWVSPEFGFDSGFQDFLVRWEIREGGSDVSSIEKADSLRDKLSILFTKLKEEPFDALANILYAAYLNYSSQEDSGAARTNSRLRNLFQSRQSGSPFFLFVNYVEPHLPYDPPEHFRREFAPDTNAEDVNQDPWRFLTGEIEMSENDFDRLKSLYEAELIYLDQQIGELIEILQELGEYEDTALFIAGDHGENLGEFGLMDHQYCLYDTLINVPMICRHPDYFPENEEFDELIELRDLYPTILEIIGESDEDANDSVSDHSFASPGESNFGREFTIAEYLEPQPSQQALRDHVNKISKDIEKYDRALRCIRTNDWKYVEATDGAEELYDLRVEVNESENIVDSHRTKRTELRTRLSGAVGDLIRAPGEGHSQMDKETKQRLEDLGYIQ